MAMKKTAKRAAKKAPAKKAAARKPRAAAAPVAPKKAAVPKGGSPFFGYVVQTSEGDGIDSAVTTKLSEFAGPFTTAKDALEDAAMIAGEEAEVIVLKAVQRGRVQKITKIVKY